MYNLIKETGLTDAQAEALTDELETFLNKRFEDRKELLATKEDVASAKTDLIERIYNAENRLTPRIYVASAIASTIQILSTLGGLFGILKLMNVL